MYKGKTIALILPARNEELSLPFVLTELPQQIDKVVVVDNGSTDDTAFIAGKHGAHVVSAPIPGYGRACLAGIAFLKGTPPDIVAFADADGSNDISRLPDLIYALTDGLADFVIEKRMPLELKAMSRLQRFGNSLTTSLIHALWKHRYYDLGPMRVIWWNALEKLGMKDMDYGWTIEMQIKALKQGLRVMEYPLPYRRRIAGKSKVSRTWKGPLLAGCKMLRVIANEALR
jgi:glycosyltransferase involved in cell wall biosynthesis